MTAPTTDEVKKEREKKRDQGEQQVDVQTSRNIGFALQSKQAPAILHETFKIPSAHIWSKTTWTVADNDGKIDE